MIRRLISAAIAVGFFATGLALAEPTKRAIKPNKTRCRGASCKVLHKRSPALRRAPQKVNFEDGDLIHGNRAAGGGSHIGALRKKSFSHLILVRPTFFPELIKSADKVW